MKRTALKGWSTGLVRALTADDPDGAVAGLAAGLANLAPSALVCVGYFRRDEPPIYVKWSDDERLAAYIKGYYLLDPLYEMFLRGSSSICLPLKDIFLPEFSGTSFFRDMYETRRWSDDVSFLVYVRPDMAAFVSLIRSSDEPLFSRAEQAMLSSVLGAVETAMVRHWSMIAPGDRSGRERPRRVHRELATAVRSFGGDVLTARELEVTGLMLKGFPPKAIGRMLEISPGTVRNHTKQIYAKLEVHSRSELMALFLEGFDAAVARLGAS